MALDLLSQYSVERTDFSLHLNEEGRRILFRVHDKEAKAQDDVKHFLCFPVCAEQGNNWDVTKKGP